MRLTPTEDLFLEVLAGRYRTGEHVWTFESRHARTARRLESKGLVGWKWGIVENSILAWLSDAGKSEVLDPSYTPPLQVV